MTCITQKRGLENKIVLVRTDFNVPLKAGKVVDDSRIREALPTIKWLIKKKAKVILVSHLGRPDGQFVPGLCLEPVRKVLQRRLRRKVLKLDTKNCKLNEIKKEELQSVIKNMKPGQVAMMENIRFSPDEKKNTGTLAKDLASLADLFVLDGFAVAHRPGASVVGVAEYIPPYAGLLLQKEIKALEKTEHGKGPCVLVLGGIKIETKLPVIKHFLKKADTILLGGGISNTYFKARGYGVGLSLVDTAFEEEALKYGRKKHVLLPVDVVVGTKNGKSYRIVDVKKTSHTLCTKEEAIFDIGPKTIVLYQEYLKRAQTIVWNGAMGYFEQEPYHIGTFALAHMIAQFSKQGAYTVMGGGETTQTVQIIGRVSDINHV
ncbi:MAG: phosphoglycerate kinase, partial [Candidatus Magasanikbacteria bacterium]